MATFLDRAYQELAESLAGYETPFQERYVNDPCGFAKDVLNVDLWSKQRDVQESVRDHRYTAVPAALSTGKTFGAAATILWFANTRPNSKVIVTAAPPERQIRDLLFAEVRSLQKNALRRGVPLVGGEPQTMRISVNDGWWIQGFTVPSSGTREEKIAKFHGHHAPGGVLVVADEAHGIPPEIFEAFDNVLSGEGCRCLLLSNPLAPSGPFWHATRDADYNIITMSALEHPNVVSGENRIPGAIDRHTTERRIKKWTASISPLDDRPDALTFEVPWTGERRQVRNPIFCYKVLGIFPWESSGALIPYAWYQRARRNYDELWEEYGDTPPDLPQPICGFDIAEFGTDVNCWVARFGKFLAPIVRWSGMEIPDTADRGARLARTFEASRVNVDGIGVGAGVAPLMRRDEINAVGVKTSWSPTRDTEEYQFKILRDQLGWAVRLWFACDDVAIPSDEDLEADVLAIEYRVTPSGIRISTKPQIRRRLMGRSPEAFDAFGLTFYEGREKGRSGISGVQTLLLQRVRRTMRGW